MNEFDKYFISFYSDCMIQIKKKMIEKNIGQSELAEMSGIKQPAISRMITMDVVPRLDTLMKVMYALGIKLKVDNE